MILIINWHTFKLSSKSNESYVITEFTFKYYNVLILKKGQGTNNQNSKSFITLLNLPENPVFVGGVFNHNE